MAGVRIATQAFPAFERVVQRSGGTPAVCGLQAGLIQPAVHCIQCRQTFFGAKLLTRFAAQVLAFCFNRI